MTNKSKNIIQQDSYQYFSLTFEGLLLCGLDVDFKATVLPVTRVATEKSRGERRGHMEGVRLVSFNHQQTGLLYLVTTRSAFYVFINNGFVHYTINSPLESSFKYMFKLNIIVTIILYYL